MVENSWGPTNGHNGYLIMTNPWFNEYTFRLVIDKKYVPENILKAYDQKPIMLTLMIHCSKRTIKITL